MTRLLLACLVATLAASCATKPMPVVDAQPGEVLAYGQPPSTEHGQVTIVRDAGFVGGGCTIEVSVDGTTAARLERGQKATIYLPTGRSTLGATYTGAALCGTSMNDRSRSDADIFVEGRDRLTYRISTDSNGLLRIAPAPKD